MKRHILALMSAIMIFAIAPQSGAQRRDAGPVQFRQISERLYQIDGGSGSQGGAYIGDTGILLVDAKMNQESVDQVTAELRKLTDKPILYLVNTHSDGDHISGNKFFPKSVIFIAHENCRNEFFKTRDGSPSEWENPDLLPFMPSITFTDRMDIYLGKKKVELWYFGVGHTTGDAVVYFPEEKTAFIGDQLFSGRPQLIHSYKGGNSFEHVKTLSRMLETLDAEKFCSGHSEIAGRETIEKHIADMKDRQAKVKALADQGKNLEAVKAAFDEGDGRLVESIYNELQNAR